MRSLLSLSPLFPLSHWLAKGNYRSSHLGPRGTSSLLRLKEPALQLGSLESSQSKINYLPFRTSSGLLAEREVNSYLVLAIVFGGLHSSLISVLAHSVQEVLTPDLATWPADTGI